MTRGSPKELAEVGAKRRRGRRVGRAELDEQDAGHEFAAAVRLVSRRNPQTAYGRPRLRLLLALRAFLGVTLLGDVAVAGRLDRGGLLGVHRRVAAATARGRWPRRRSPRPGIPARTPRNRCNRPGRCTASSRPGRSTRRGRRPRNRCTCSRGKVRKRCASSGTCRRGERTIRFAVRPLMRSAIRR